MLHRRKAATDKLGGYTLDLDDNSLLRTIARHAELLLLWRGASVEDGIAATILHHCSKATQPQQRGVVEVPTMVLVAVESTIAAADVGGTDSGDRHWHHTASVTVWVHGLKVQLPAQLQNMV